MQEDSEEISGNLRSNYVDVSEIAEIFNGGGHKRAAGLTAPILVRAIKAHCSNSAENTKGSLMNGIINVNKPIGITSFDVVSKIRRLYQIKKVGHAGTLDPDASGVLPLCIGKATKVIEYLMDKDKAYRVELVLGMATDTQDASGNIILEEPVLASNDEIKAAIKSFLGKQEQIPPMYSAVRINGKRLYELARKGIEVERNPRPVTFYK